MLERRGLIRGLLAVKSRVAVLAALVAIGLLPSGTAQSQDAAFAGKTITVVVHTPPGGGYDAYARLLSRHLGRFIAGNPHVIVANKPGAGGYLAANYAANVAPRDGTVLALMQQSTLVDEAMGTSPMRTSMREFNWIGNFSQSNNVLAVWHTSPVKTIGDAQKRDTPVGASGANSTAAQLPAFLNAILGTRFKVVRGYEGGANIDIAMQRGEVEGRGANTWASYKSTNVANLREGNLRFLVQVGGRKEPDLPDVPLLTELAKGDPAKEQAARFVSLGLSIARPLAAPPGVPADRVDMLRRAFNHVVKDPQFLDEANRLSLEVDPMTGEEVQGGIAQILATPTDVIDKLRAAVATHNN